MSTPRVEKGTQPPTSRPPGDRDARRRSYSRIVVAQDMARSVLRERRRCNGDRYDEVWDGTYYMSPLANIEHQEIATQLCFALMQWLGSGPGLHIYQGINVSDREDDWTENFRCPDVAVYLPGNPAKARDTHWLGGPDFAVEVLSRGDRARKKFDFYFKVGVRELLLIDRGPWALELYSRGDRGMQLVGNSTVLDANSIASTVVGANFRLLAAEPRPRIGMETPDGKQWLA